MQADVRLIIVFCFKQKTSYEMRISDWSSDVCSSDLLKLDKAAARRVVDSLSLFGIGFSWGGFESLVQLVDHAALRSHSYWQPTDNAIVRLHIGLESPQALIADLAQDLEQAARG